MKNINKIRIIYPAEFNAEKDPEQHIEVNFGMEF